MLNICKDNPPSESSNLLEQLNTIIKDNTLDSDVRTLCRYAKDHITDLQKELKNLREEVPAKGILTWVTGIYWADGFEPGATWPSYRIDGSVPHSCVLKLLEGEKPFMIYNLRNIEEAKRAAENHYESWVKNA